MLACIRVVILGAGVCGVNQRINRLAVGCRPASDRGDVGSERGWPSLRGELGAGTGSVPRPAPSVAMLNFARWRAAAAGSDGIAAELEENRNIFLALPREAWRDVC